MKPDNEKPEAVQEQIEGEEIHRQIDSGAVEAVTAETELSADEALPQSEVPIAQGFNEPDTADAGSGELEPADDELEAAVTYEGGRPLVQELEYQVQKSKAGTPAEDDENADVKFSSVSEAKAVIEGFLFSCNEPLSVSRLSKLMSNLHPKTVRGLLLELQWEYENRPGGLQVVEIAGGYQMSTRAFVAPWMFRLHKHKRRSALSPATLETLAIIAYRQPITKGEIEAIRGVESGAPLRTLQELNLIEASGRREVIGRPQLYVTTEQFLKTFGLKSVGDLPSISELKSRYAEEQKLKPVVAAAAEKTDAESAETDGELEQTNRDEGTGKAELEVSNAAPGEPEPNNTDWDDVEEAGEKLESLHQGEQVSTDEPDESVSDQSDDEMDDEPALKGEEDLDLEDEERG